MGKIHNYLDSKWEFQESPIVYIREGDAPDINIEGSVEKTHPAGYRSVHYIISTRLLKHSIYTEIQVRTIFEEAWSEIDHRVRYPNFKNNEILNYFLLIFNRFAGSADEMGTFVLSLKNELKESIERSIKISEIEKEKETYLAKIDELVSNLEADQKITLKTKNELKQVKSKLDSFQKKENDLYRQSLFQRLNNSSSVSGIQHLSSKSHDLFGNLESKTARNITSRGLINSLTNNNETLRKMKITIEDLNLDSDGKQKKPPKK